MVGGLILYNAGAGASPWKGTTRKGKSDVEKCRRRSNSPHHRRIWKSQQPNIGQKILRFRREEA